jgi:hypothetical protein
LDYSSSAVKDPQNQDIKDEIKDLFTKARPRIVFTHNLADKHDTHVAVTVKVINSIRELPEELRPEKLYGGEVWRSLDWVNDDEKVALDVSSHPNIGAALVEVFDSQICGGKRYDMATMGRRMANATYSASHGTDTSSYLTYAIDLTPLIKEVNLDINDYIQSYIDRFSKDVSDRISKFQK